MERVPSFATNCLESKGIRLFVNARCKICNENITDTEHDMSFYKKCIDHNTEKHLLSGIRDFDDDFELSFSPQCIYCGKYILVANFEEMKSGRPATEVAIHLVRCRKNV